MSDELPKTAPSKQAGDRAPLAVNERHLDPSPGSLWECRISELVERLASTSPTPGGGSCAALVASMGAALFTKSLAVSLKKMPAGAKQRTTVEALVDQANEHAIILQGGSDRDAAAFEGYLRAVRLPQHDPAAAKIRKAAIEAAIVDATTIPIATVGEIHQLMASGLRALPLIHNVIVSDATIALRLLMASATCLLITAEDNLSGLRQSPPFELLRAQLQDQRQQIAGANRELEQCLRKGTR